MSASAQVEMVSRWKLDNSALLAAEMTRLRLLLRRRVLWLSSQWSHEAAQDYLACKISDAQADWLLGGEDRKSEAAFYSTDSEALQLTASLQRLEDSIAERSQAIRDAGMPAALDVLQHLFALGRFERDALLLVIAPHLDPSFERLYAYLQDDVTCRYPTPHLALVLLTGDDEEMYRAREALLPDGTLRRYRLIAADEEGQANIFANRALRTDERVLNFLLGANRPDERLRSLLDEVPPASLAVNDRQQVARVLAWLQPGAQSPMRTVNFVGESAAGLRNLARATSDALGIGLLELKAANLPAAPADRHEMLSLVEREAVLMHSAFYCDLDLERGVHQHRLALHQREHLVPVGGRGGKVRRFQFQQPNAEGVGGSARQVAQTGCALSHKVHRSHGRLRARLQPGEDSRHLLAIVHRQRRRRHFVEQRPQPFVGTIGSEQEVQYTLIGAKGAIGEDIRLTLLISGDQAIAPQRSIRQQGLARPVHLFIVAGQQNQRQMRSWIPAGDVVLEIGVEALKRGIQVRSNDQQQSVPLEAAQSEQMLQDIERRRHPCIADRLRAFRNRVFQTLQRSSQLQRFAVRAIERSFRFAVLTAEQPIGLGVADLASQVILCRLMRPLAA